jgi:hypothetical protein
MLGAVRLEIDPTLADSAARISLNGSELEVVCDAARGSADKPLTIAETKDKFCSICGLDEPRRLMQAIEEGTDDLAALVGVR